MAAPIRVGVCSWADETLTKVWYPKGVKSGEDRLRYYAERFDVVEANSTYYRLPDPAMVGNWAERTPPGFTMHVKAFGVMTRHPVKVDQLPTDLRDVPTDARGRVDRPPREYRAEMFRRFREALEPLRSAGKLGGILMQFPPYVVYRPQSLEYLEWSQEQLPGEEMLVEFRHASRRHERHGLRPLSRPQRPDLEQADGKRGRALRLPLFRGRATRVGAAAAGARRRDADRLRDVQQQRPLGDAVAAAARGDR